MSAGEQVDGRQGKETLVTGYWFGWGRGSIKLVTTGCWVGTNTLGRLQRHANDFVLFKAGEVEKQKRASFKNSHLKSGDLEENQQPEMRRRAHRVSGSVEDYEPWQGLETPHLREQRGAARGWGPGR